MTIDVRTVEYFYARVENESRNAYEMLARLAADDVNGSPSAPFHSDLNMLS